jgi:transaldolase
MPDSPLIRLHEFGQSPWLDYLDRGLLQSGRLNRMVTDRGIRGVTSNPAIFEQAIVRTDHYRDEIERLAREGLSAGEIYETLAFADIRAAADVLAPLYEDSGRGDGFVSIELSPHLVDDAQATVVEGRRLWALLDRPNVMLKVPATDAGLVAVRELIAEGMNVNVTLLFSLERYRDVIDAYLEGLEYALEAGRSLKKVASVASFFLSRIDTIVDPLLEPIVFEGGTQGERARRLRGEVAIASAKRAYAIFQKSVKSKRFRELERHGARAQRLLWASTGTKNPAYSDVKYVEALIGPATVNTMPMDTLEAYHDHGNPATRLTGGLDRAARLLKELGALGIDLETLCAKLLTDGIAKFIKPFDDLHEAIDEQRRAAG